MRRVPVIRQMSSLECGAACLTMVLNYYGREISLSECRNNFGIGRDGTSALVIAEAARAHGLEVEAYSLNPDDLEHVPLPAIAHWKFNHFVVVEQWSPKNVLIVDPASGRRKLLSAEFDSAFTGVVLTFKPGQQFETRSKSTGSFWRHYHPKYLIPVRGSMFQILMATLILQALGLTLPLFTKVVVDYVLPFRLTNVLAILGLGVIAVIAAQMISSYLRASLLFYVQIRLDSQFMMRFFKHLMTLPFSFFQQRATGDLVMRLGSNSIIREVLTSQTLSLILDGSLVIVYLTIILIQSLTFGLLVFTIGMVQILLLWIMMSKIQRLTQAELAAQAQSQSYLVETLTGIQTVKASGAEDNVLNHWSNLFFNQLHIAQKRNRLSALIETGMLTLRTFAPVILLWFGTYRVIDGDMSLGTMLALNALAVACLMPLSSLTFNWQRLQLVKSHLERITDVLDSAPEQDIETVQDAPPLEGRIELKEVSFKYDPNAPLVLRNISIIIEPGQKVAIVGRTGSGKSTLGKLLLGLYPPTAGEIFYDRIPLRDLNYRTVRNQFGVVLQESALFSGSIRQNIAFGNPSLELEQIKDAARRAAIHDDIMKMPMEYETPVAEGSAGLAGGQRQRLAIARAIAHKPAILLMDEATSHLDAITEDLVEQNLGQLSCTRIVIAHRLSTIRNADIIFVLDEGQIIEQGKHDELFTQDGLYTTLVNTKTESETRLC